MEDLWTDRLSEYVDDELTPAERAGLDAHLTSCRACVATVAELRAVVERARRLPDPLPASDLWPGVAQQIERPHRLARLWHTGASVAAARSAKADTKAG